jgi:TetR/AcrR family transcriptional regulator
MASGTITYAETEPTQRMLTSRSKEPKRLSNSRKSDKRRGEIIRVAIEIINAKSYAQATMIDIAAALDLRDATLYHYFHDKRTLAYACHRSSLERAQKLLEASDQTDESGAEKLRHFIRTMLVESKQYGPLLYLGDYSYLDAAQRKVIREWTDRLKGILVKFLNQGMSDGSIITCEPELVVQLLLGMIIWLGKWVPSIRGLTLDRLMEAIETFGFRGLAAPDAPSSRKRLSSGTLPRRQPGGRTLDADSNQMYSPRRKQ